MKLFSYILAHDTGFAPNPFGKYCTLANCKPVIRRTANVGDWIVGLSSKSCGNRIIYVMEVNEILPFQEYFEDKRFQYKKPDFSSNLPWQKYGDNIYKPLCYGKFKQLQSMHSVKQSKIEDNRNKKRDLSGQIVLISEKFYYFGKNAIPVQPEFSELIICRGHKCRFSEEFARDFAKFIKSNYKKGMHGYPSTWQSSIPIKRNEDMLCI